MDTDDLSPMAYETLSKALLAFEPMRAEIGALACDYRCEDEYLTGILSFLDEILESPADYLDFWNSSDEIDIKRFRNSVKAVHAHVKLTLSTPKKSRGSS